MGMHMAPTVTIMTTNNQKTTSAGVDEHSFTLELERLQDYEFRIKFDWDTAPELLLDEPAPLGNAKGPNASRLLASAVANCLSASLLFCMIKSRLEPPGMKTTVTGRLARNNKRLLRVEAMDVVINLTNALDVSGRMDRCLGLFEDYCVVTQSVRQGIPVHVKVMSNNGDILYQD